MRAHSLTLLLLFQFLSESHTQTHCPILQEVATSSLSVSWSQHLNVNTQSEVLHLAVCAVTYVSNTSFIILDGVLVDHSVYCKGEYLSMKIWN